MSKKVLIMSASTGGGHNRAARAIQEEIEKHNIFGESIECIIIDSLKLVNTTIDKIISTGYEKSAIYTPKAYGKVYSISESNLVSKNEFKDNILSNFMAKKFRALIAQEKPDLIIGTHPFPMIALSSLKKHIHSKKISHSSLGDVFSRSNKNINVPPMISVLTDYTTHSTWVQPEIDYYIVGHEYVKQLLVDDNVNESKIKPYGIPVEKSFLKNRNRDIVLKELKLNPNKFTVLLMGGSFGAGNIKETFDELLNIHRDFQVLVITGRNQSLKEKLEKRLSYTSQNKNIAILGFTNKMNDILASVDILITKPGGLTTTEALLKNIPMIVPYYIPGQEEENLDFLCNCGVALKTTKKYNLSVLLKVLIDDPNRISILKSNINSVKKENSSINISKLVIDLLKK